MESILHWYLHYLLKWLGRGQDKDYQWPDRTNGVHVVKRATLAGVAGALDVPNISTAMYESGPLASAIKTGFTLCSELENIMSTTR